MARKPTLAVIEGQKVRLRPLDETDLPMTLAWRNQDAIREWFFYSRPITPEQHRAWFLAYQSDDSDLVFIIEENLLAKRPIGQVALYHIDWAQRRAEFGRLMIGEADARNRGLAREATQLLLEFGFCELGIHEIYLEVYEDNLSAVNLYRACGFTETGRQGRVLRMTCTTQAGPK